MLLFYLKGLLIGCIIALPFGPVGLLCLHRSVSGGVAAGLLSGLGAALADALYGCVAAFGLTFVSSFMNAHHVVLQVVGGLFLGAMGVRLFLDTSAVGNLGDSEVGYHKLLGTMASMFGLAIANPMTVVAFLAIFAGFGLGQPDSNAWHALAVVLGVFSGSMLWWVLIAFGGNYLREKITTRMAVVKRISGIVIAVFGAWAVGEMLV